MENYLLDSIGLEHSIFMAVPGHPGSIFSPEDQQVATGIITPECCKLVAAEVVLDFTLELLALDV